jgi:hypothetical protein
MISVFPPRAAPFAWYPITVSLPMQGISSPARNRLSFSRRPADGTGPVVPLQNILLTRKMVLLIVIPRVGKRRCALCHDRGRFEASLIEVPPVLRGERKRFTVCRCARRDRTPRTAEESAGGPPRPGTTDAVETVAEETEGTQSHSTSNKEDER